MASTLLSRTCWVKTLTEPFAPLPAFKHPLGGNISEWGPSVFSPATGVVTLAADDNSTIDMTAEQAHWAGRRLIKLAGAMEKWVDPHD